MDLRLKNEAGFGEPVHCDPPSQPYTHIPLGFTIRRSQDAAMPTFGFVIDNRKCIGCHACTVACKSEHQVPVGVDRTWVKYVGKENSVGELAPVGLDPTSMDQNRHLMLALARHRGDVTADALCDCRSQSRTSAWRHPDSCGS